MSIKILYFLLFYMKIYIIRIYKKIKILLLYYPNLKKKHYNLLSKEFSGLIKKSS